MITTSRLILSSLIKNQEYTKKVFPFIKVEYFDQEAEKVVFSLISSHIQHYSALPTIDAISIELEQKSIRQAIFDDCMDCITDMQTFEDKHEQQWLFDVTEKFCKDQSLFLALQQSIEIASDLKNGKNSSLTETIIPKLLTEAISVTFDESIGHDFFEDKEQRYELYHTVEAKIPFDIPVFNRITNGGLSKKTTTVIIGGTNVGKTLIMCHLAANNLTDGKNVLYITLEMSHDEIAKRIEGNLLNIPVNDIAMMSKKQYIDGLDKIKTKTLGKLIIYDDLTGNGNTNLFKRVIDDLKIKKGFVPDIIYVDYLGAMSSSVYKMGSVNTYTFFKSIAEELRQMSKQFDVAIVTASQYNRSGFNSSDADMTNIAESFGINFSADLVFTAITSDELERLGQFEIKQLKNRYQNKGELPSFYIGVDKPKMRLYALDSGSSHEPTQTYTNFDMDESELDDKLERMKRFNFS